MEKIATASLTIRTFSSVIAGAPNARGRRGRRSATAPNKFRPDAVQKAVDGDGLGITGCRRRPVHNGSASAERTGREQDRKVRSSKPRSLGQFNAADARQPHGCVQQIDPFRT